MSTTTTFSAGTVVTSTWANAIDAAVHDPIVALVNDSLVSYASLDAAVTGIGTTRCTVFVKRDITMSANATFPSTAKLEVVNRARITTTSYTLTLNQKEVPARPVQWIAGTGTVVMNGVEEVYPEWWGAVSDGSTDCTSAIEAADAVACTGTLGLDGVTVVANSRVIFQPGTYKITSTLTYRGAPWRGAGIASTFIKLYASANAAVDAVGTNTARKILSIRDMTFNGSSATSTAHGIRIGYNQRSFPAFESVRIDSFPGPGIYVAANTWSMSFRDLYLSFNASAWQSSGWYVAGGVTALAGLEFFNLQLENNGVAGSGVGGGMHIPSTCAAHGLRFYGGVFESNYGGAEAWFTTVNGVYLYGLYVESDNGSTIHGLVFDGQCIGTVNGPFITAQTGMAGGGSAIYVGNTSIMSIDSPNCDDDWPIDISAANTAIVNLVGAGQGIGTMSVASGAQFHRLTPKRVQLTDAATIAIDAALGNEFYVTLGGNRTVGAPTNPSVGQMLNLLVTQDATGGRTLTFNAVFKVSWSDTGNTANKRSSIQFRYDGTNWNQIGAQSPYI